MSIDHDPWLYPGCMCEVWNNENKKDAMYFWDFNSQGEPYFRKNNTCYTRIYFEHYRPVNTPWDYAPKEAEYLIIDDYGTCYFTDKTRKEIQTDRWNNHSYKTIIIFNYNNCPDHLKNKTWPRPRWA